MSNDSSNVLFYTTLMGLAYKDSLTGLANRRAAEAYLSQLQDGQELFFLMLDIQNFKAVNDTKGYAAGDKTLKDVAQNLQSSLRAEDFLFRLGGDEFGLFIKIKSESDLMGILNRLQTALLCVGHSARFKTAQLQAPMTLEDILENLD